MLLPLKYFLLFFLLSYHLNHANSAFDIKCIKIIGSNGVNLENKVIEVETEKIDLELNDDALKKKKIVKKNKSL